MSRNIQITPQQSRAVTPLASDSQGDGAQSVVVDDLTFWTGRDYGFFITNQAQYTRWYRLVVTDLKRNDEYAIFTQFGRMDEDNLLEIEPGDEYQINIVLGGEGAREPNAPKQFEVYVQEYATPDERGQYKPISNDRLQWIPKPSPNSIAMETPRSELYVRPWPWKQRVQFDATLVNRSYLPITAEVRALPADDSKEAGLEGTRETLRQPIPARVEQPVRCDILLEKRLKAPVSLTVDATASVPALDMQVETTPHSVQIIPVPFLKVWSDWIVVALGAFLFVWLFFGMPPVVRPVTIVTLHLDKDLPEGVKPSDLTLKIEPINTTAFAPKEGKLLNADAKNNLMYKFDWGWMRKGMRLGWNTYNLRLKQEQGQTKSSNPYSEMIYDSGGVDKVTISENGGVSESSIKQHISFSTMKPAFVSIPSGDPRAPFTYTITDDATGDTLPSGASEGDAAQITVPMATAARRVKVNVAVNNKTFASHDLSLEPGKTVEFPTWKSKEEKPIQSDPPINPPKKDPPGKTDPPINPPKKDPPGKTDPPINPPKKDLPGKTDPPINPPKKDVLTAGKKAKIIESIRLLHIPVDVQDVIAQQAATKKGFYLTTFSDIDKVNQKIALTVKANTDCLLQIYSIEGEDKVLPQFGKDGVAPTEQNDGRPVLLKAGEGFPLNFKITEGKMTLVFVAFKPIGQVNTDTLNTDLLPVLQTPSIAPELAGANNAAQWAVAVETYQK